MKIAAEGKGIKKKKKFLHATEKHKRVNKTSFIFIQNIRKCSVFDKKRRGGVRSKVDKMVRFYRLFIGHNGRNLFANVWGSTLPEIRSL